MCITSPESRHWDVPYLKHVLYRGALLDCQLRYVEALATVPPYLQLLLGELQQVIQRFIVYLTIRRSANTGYITWYTTWYTWSCSASLYISQYDAL